MIFEKVSTILQWVVQHETEAKWLSPFLDDYILLEPSTECLVKLMLQFTDIMDQVGMPLATDKTLGPSNIIEYLGLVLNLFRQLILIPEKKRNNCLEKIDQLLQVHDRQGKTTVKKIQQLAGKLNFICQALPAGRPFIQSLYKLTWGTAVKQHHHRQLTAEVVGDLNMFRSFLLESAPQKVKSVPFLNRLGVHNSEIQFFADAAGAKFRALSCLYENNWCQGYFSYGFHPNIALLELLAIVMTAEVWAPQLTGRTIILHSDNRSACDMINFQKAEIPACMQLIRHLAK